MKSVPLVVKCFSFVIHLHHLWILDPRKLGEPRSTRGANGSLMEKHFTTRGTDFTRGTFYKLRMGLCSILTGITKFWVFFMGLETVFTLFHHEWWKRVMEKGFSFFHHSFLSLFSITLFHHSFPSLVMEKSENCFQTHEEKREKNWVIPFGIEQKVLHALLTKNGVNVLRVLILVGLYESFKIITL